MLLDQAFDYAIRKSTESVGGGDLGTKILTRQQIQQAIGGPAGRNVSGLGYDARETVRRQGIYPDLNEPGTRIKTDLSQQSTLVTQEKTNQILEQTSMSANELRKDTNGLLRKLTSELTRDLNNGFDRLDNTYKREGAVAAAKLFLEGLKDAALDATGARAAGAAGGRLAYDLITRFRGGKK